MLLLRKIFVVLACAGFAMTRSAQLHENQKKDWQRFSSLLDTVDERVLHKALHSAYPKFKDGIFNKDRTAVEQVHSENPMIASKLLYIAKRQSTNSVSTNSVNTTTTATTTFSTSVTDSTSSLSSTTTPPPITTTTTTSNPPDQSTQAPASTSDSAAESAISSALSSALSNDFTATSVPPPTTVFVITSTPTSATAIRTESGGVVFSSSGGVVTVSSSPINVHFTPSTKTNTFYKTLSNGAVETTTSTIVVNVPITQNANSVSTTSAGLQNGSVKVANGGMAGLMIGVAGFIAAW